MKWLVQEFLNKNENVARVMRALKDTNTEFLLLRLNKDESLSVLDKETKLPIENSDSYLNSFIENENIMLYGSKTFMALSGKLNLFPGSFMNENFEFDVFKTYLGEELLNSEFVIGELKDLEPLGETFFIRPTGNTKLFSGMVVTKEEFNAWKKRENAKESPYAGQKLMISPVREIPAEYRFFVVNEKIVTCSSYRKHGIYNIKEAPSKELINYAKHIIDRFSLAKAFVVDIGETKEGFKVVEYNNINTSSLYGCSEKALVKAINNMSF